MINQDFHQHESYGPKKACCDKEGVENLKIVEGMNKCCNKSDDCEKNPLYLVDFKSREIQLFRRYLKLFLQVIWFMEATIFKLKHTIENCFKKKTAQGMSLKE